MDFALLHRAGGLFTHRYCFKLLSLCAIQPQPRHALRIHGKASNAGLDRAIQELRTLDLVNKVIGCDDTPVFEITDTGRHAIRILSLLSGDLQSLWPEAPRRS